MSSSPSNPPPQAKDPSSPIDTPSDVVDVLVRTHDPAAALSPDAHDDASKSSSDRESLSHRDLDASEADADADEIRFRRVPMKKAPRPVRRPPAPSSYVSRFSYDPRPDERAYYRGLFDYVSSFVEADGGGGGKEPILPPKLVADKLLLASKIPSDALRVIWNRATAVVPAPADGGATPPSSESTGGGRDGSRSSAGSASGKSGVVAGRVVVMTRSQFDTAIRLIQLFQNRASAADPGLKRVHRSEPPEGDAAAGATMQGKPVEYDRDGLLPAYFAGVSGVYLAVPGTSEYRLNGGGGVIPTKAKNGIRRRSVDDELGAFGARRGAGRNDAADVETRRRDEWRLERLEREVAMLKKIVLSLHTEVKTLKAAARGGGSRRASVESGRGSVASSGSKKAVAAVNRLNNGVVTVRQGNTGAGAKVQNNAANQKLANKAESLGTHKEADEDSEPNTGVESFWGAKEVPQLEYPIKLAPSLQNQPKEPRNNPPAAKEVASFDPAARKDLSPPNVSSNIPTVHPGKARVKEVASFDPKPDAPVQNASPNIPSVHPPAVKRSVRVQPKVGASPSPGRALPQARANVPGNLKLSESSSDSATRKSTIRVQPKVGASMSPGQMHPQSRANVPGNLMTSGSSAGTNSVGSRRGRLASSLGSNSNPNYPLNQNGVKMGPGARRGNLASSLGSNSNQEVNGDHFASYAPVRRRPDPGEASVHSAQTHRVANGGNLRSSLTLAAAALSSITGNAQPPVAENGDFSEIGRPSLTKQKVAPARPPARRLTREMHFQSVRHLVRATDGTEREYKEKDAPPSTAAVDLKPLEPAPMTTTSILKNKESEIKQKKKAGWVRRLSSG